MSEFDDLEDELRSLRPKPPTPAFTARVEDALGDAGTVAVRRITDSSSNRSSKLLYFVLSTSMLAALLVAVFFMISSDSTDLTPRTQPGTTPLSKAEEYSESPIHGVSMEELESFSGMPVDGWLDPQVNQRLLRRVDEGLIDGPDNSPVRQVRYHYLDETIWMHPASDIRILSTTPRQEVFLIDLELY
jgi:uncharacterized integral membrane protein